MIVEDQVYPQTFSLKEKLLPLPFTAFYFFNWYYAPNEIMTHVVSTIAFLIFIVLHFKSYTGYKEALWCPIIMIVMTPLVSHYNLGANCFAIFGCASIAHTQKVKVATFWLVVCLVMYALISWWKAYPWLTYFAISTIVTIGVFATGLGQRQTLLNIARERAGREEIHRLSKLTEHHRIGQDMHDLLGHTLTGIHLKSNLALRLLEKGEVEAAQEHLRYIEKAVQQSMSDVRKAVVEYKSLSLEEELISQAEYLKKLGVDFTYSSLDSALPIKLESDLVMLVREAVNNTLKHSGANKIEFELRQSDGQISIVYRDNGSGFVDKVQYEGSGVEGMKNRIQHHGGRIEFNDNHGLTIMAQIPRTDVAL